MTATNVEAPPLARKGSPRRESGSLAGRLTGGLLVKLLIAVIVIAEIYPMFWLLTNSLKTKSEIVDEPLWSLPSGMQWHNYVDAWTTGSLGHYALNSLIVTVPSLILILLLGAAAGFALEVMVWKGRNAVLFLIVGGMMVPLQMVLLPLFTIYFNLNLSDSYLPLIITYVGHGLPLTVFMMATYFRAVPRELFEAVAIEGGGPFRCFFSIGLPLIRNGLFTIGLLQFFSVWNDLLIALTFNVDSKLSTVQVGLLHFSDEYGSVDYGPLFAAISITVFGTLAVYLILNQQVMRGLTAGSVKG
ncbi:carbohydrate ABC transporter permease [Dactylosporangium sp. NPDC051541]|uniref:carbohydrate ABC transporter permease n=1 Tax=Dactylosporangium sp. NPDC051541 TaxID=3363977 RepID=UPI003793BE52